MMISVGSVQLLKSRAPALAQDLLKEYIRTKNKGPLFLEFNSIFYFIIFLKSIKILLVLKSSSHCLKGKIL